MSLIKWLTRSFRTYVPTELFEKTYEDLDSAETRSILNAELDANNIIRTKTPEDCYQVMVREREIGEKTYADYGKAHKEELQCAALALELSRKYPASPVYLLTDDLKARSIITYLFQKQQIGTVLCSFDFLIYLFVRHKTIGPKFAERALRDLRLVLRAGTLKRVYYWSQQYENFLQESCRSRCNKCYLP